MSPQGMRLHDLDLERSSRTSRELVLADNSPGGFLKFQAARLWIPLAGIARRLDIPPQAIRRLDAVERNSFRLFHVDRCSR